MGLDADSIDEIKLAIIEACINAMEHSGSEDRKVSVDFEIGEEALTIQISDRGQGFDLSLARDQLEQRREAGTRTRGWGLQIMEELMDEVRVESGENGTVITMVKRREEHYRDKILSTLADIPGLRVAVTVDLDMTKRVTQNLKHAPPQPKEEKVSTSEQGSSSQPAESGVQANLGQAVTSNSPGKSSTTELTTTLKSRSSPGGENEASTRITTRAESPGGRLIGNRKTCSPGPSRVIFANRRPPDSTDTSLAGELSGK